MWDASIGRWQIRQLSHSTVPRKFFDHVSSFPTSAPWVYSLFFILQLGCPLINKLNEVISLIRMLLGFPIYSNEVAPCCFLDLECSCLVKLLSFRFLYQAPQAPQAPQSLPWCLPHGCCLFPLNLPVLFKHRLAYSYIYCCHSMLTGIFIKPYNFLYMSPIKMKVSLDMHPTTLSIVSRVYIFIE